MKLTLHTLFFCLVFAFGSSAFAANKCVHLFQTATPPKAVEPKNSLLKPTTDEISFAENAKAIENRLRGSKGEQRKTINVPEFERFVTELKRKLIITKGSIPKRHFLLHHKLSKLITRADNHLKQNSLIYDQIILLAAESTHAFTEAILVKEGKNVVIDPDAANDGFFTKVLFYGAKKLGNHLQTKDIYKTIYHEDTFVIPTMRSLSLNDFLLVADLNVAYVGIVDTRITYDGRVNGTPRQFLVHDFQHIVNARPREELQKQGLFIKKAMDVAATKPANIRIAMGVLLFYYTHELTQITHEGTIQNPRLDAYLEIIEGRRSNANDLGDRPEVRKVLQDGHSVKEALAVLRDF